MHLLLILGCFADASTAPPLILVSLDTLRADRLGAYGNTHHLTPNLDQFAAEAVLFEHAYSQTITTTPSHASMFTSRYPSELIGQARQPTFGDKPLLASVLQTYGYATGAFVAGGDLSPEMGFNIGFDAYESADNFASLYHTVPMALRWIDTVTDKPFFAFIHGYDAHERYLKPPPYGLITLRRPPDRNLLAASTNKIIDGVLYPDTEPFQFIHERLLRPRTPEGQALFEQRRKETGVEGRPLSTEELAVVTAMYDGAAAYADTQFGLMMAAFAERGLLDRAVIVVMSDHGEQLGEDGVFGHCCGVSDAETHVPLMVRMPEGKGGGTKVSGYVGLIDVMPTLLELAGAQPPANIAGQSLAPALRGEPFAGRDAVYSQGNDRMRSVTARTPQGRLTYTGLSCTSSFLPPLIAAARLDGPGFTGDVPDRAPVRDGMVAWLKGLEPSPFEPKAQLSEELRRSLQSHGYWNVQ